VQCRLVQQQEQRLLRQRSCRAMITSSSVSKRIGLA
jgi:hypothetical protein